MIHCNSKLPLTAGWQTELKVSWYSSHQLPLPWITILYDDYHDEWVGASTFCCSEALTVSFSRWSKMASENCIRNDHIPSNYVQVACVLKIIFLNFSYSDLCWLLKNIQCISVFSLYQTDVHFHKNLYTKGVQKIYLYIAVYCRLKNFRHEKIFSDHLQWWTLNWRNIFFNV